MIHPFPSMNLDAIKIFDKVLGPLVLLILKPVVSCVGLILRRNHSLEKNKKISVIKILGGGSLIIAFPMLRSLREKYPEAVFCLVCSKGVKPYAELLHVFDHIQVIDTGSLFSFLNTAALALKRIFKSDACIDLEIHSYLTTIFSLISLSRNRFGFYMNQVSWRKGIDTDLYFYNERTPINIAYNQIASAFGIEINNPDLFRDKFQALNNFQRYDYTELTHKLNISLAPFSSDLSPEREFSGEEWSQLISAEIQDDFNLHILGGPADVKKSKVLEQALKEAFGSRVAIYNHAGRLTLKESLNVIYSSDFLFAIDSGLNHVARLLNTFIYSFWGPTSPHLLLTQFKNVRERVHYKNMFCSPCVHIVDTPPCKGHNICLKAHIPGTRHNEEIERMKILGWSIVKGKGR